MRPIVTLLLIVVICTVGLVHNTKKVNTSRTKRDVNYEGDAETVKEYKQTEKELARKRILYEFNRSNNRRKRQPYNKHGKFVYNCCIGYTYYKPCVPYKPTCRTRVPTSTQKPAKTIYHGPARNWTGPLIGCKCNKNGSEISTCDIVTGQCRCKPHYVGRTCHKCEDGFWDSPTGCMKCDCDPEGSESQFCDSKSGYCLCKPGVDGKKCDTCKRGFYGFSKSGCKACEVCNKVGHICDPDTGRCICPPNSHGEKCNLCTPNSWGHEPNKGCKLCNCSDTGSIKPQCNLLTGVCFCQQGYSGYKCNQCDHGYYGYPKCRRCSCSYAGTDKDLGKCDNGICQCNSNGACPCKTNVSGKRCNHCKDGTFGLHQENLEGCTQCFCFGRSTICKEAGYTWGKIRAQNRTLSVDFIDDYNKQNRRIISNDILDLSNFEEIEGTTGDVTRSHDHFDIPLYWKLPNYFNGDRILSYGGYLRFQTATHGAKNPRHNIFKPYPLIWIEGNGIKLYFEPLSSHLHNNYEIRIHESSWKCLHTLDNVVSRELLMVALQRVTSIFIKATEYSRFEKVTLNSGSLDKAIEVPGNPPPLAMGVEKCECPHEYSGSSCQNPNTGYTRYRTDHPPIISPTINNHVIDAVVGKSKRCQCNGRSSVCNIETGECLNCTEHTSGKACERCAEGYHGDPMEPNGKCTSCACPSATQNFAVSCSPNPRSNYFICKCKEGYFGPTCDRCGAGYYGQPHLPGGSCKPCNCNKDGRINNECDQKTGNCNCKLGITGPKCSQCEKARHVLENNKCIPCDSCIQILLDKLDQMTLELVQNTSHIQNGALHPPWETFNEFENRYTRIQNNYDNFLDNRDKLSSQIDDNELKIFEDDAKLLKEILKTSNTSLTRITKATDENMDRAEKISAELNKTNKELKKLMQSLNEFGKSRINTNEALAKGEQLIEVMREKFGQVESYHPKANEVANNCNKIYNRIKTIRDKGFTDPKAIKEKLYTFSNRLFKLETILSEIKAKINQQTAKQDRNYDHYKQVNDTLELLERSQKAIQEKLKQEKTTVDETMKLLDNIEKDHKKFLEMSKELHELNQKVEEKSDLLDDNIELLEKYKDEIDKHTKNLQKNFTDYKNSFHLSNDELNAVNASGRFKQIVMELSEANKTIHEAKSDFNNLLVTSIAPEGEDSIYDNTAIATADSERLVKRVNVLEKQLKNFKDRSNKFNSLTTKLESSLWENGLKNNNNTKKLSQMLENVKNSEDMYKRIDAHIKQAVEHSESMRKVYKDAMNINISMQYGQVKDYKKYLNLTSSESVKHFQENLKVTTDLLQNVTSFSGKTDIDIIKTMNQAIENFKSKKDAIQLKLQELKAIIKKTEQIAAIIQVPMNGSSCSRSYKIPNMEPAITTYIKVHFTSNGADGGLIYINNEQQYISLEVINRKIQFKWNLGDAEQLLSSNQLIKSEDELKVSIRRIQRKVSLKVNDELVFGNTKTIPLNFDPSNLLHVGYNGKEVIGLPGCIKDIKIEDHVVGLWEFKESVGTCTGCYRNSTIQGGSRYKFNGQGYIIDQVPKNSDPRQFNVKFKMRTFDENALLFLAYFEGTYMAILLRNRHLYCELHYQNKKIAPIILQSTYTYNNGSEILVDCTKVFKNDNDQLIFDIENAENLNDSRIISRSDLLKIKKSNLYYGGVPPDFSLTEFRNLSFLGLLNEVTFWSQPLSLQNTQYYGVELTPIDDIAFNDVTFDEGGYVVVNKPLKPLSQIDFIVRTSSTDGLLLRIEKERISFKLKSGKIVVEVDGKRFMESTVSVNNEEYCYVNLEKTETDMTLFINGTEQMKKEYALKEAKPNELHYIYIGGMQGENNRFTGLIKNIILLPEDSQPFILYINKETYVDSEHAKIGRHKISKAMYYVQRKRVEVNVHTENDSMKDMQQSDGCDKINYNLEPNAVKFGDAPNSCVLHNLKDSFWKLDYTIDFEFRTFYSDGLLLISYGPKDHYTLVEIKDGFIQLHVKGKKNKKILIGSKIDDGNWHRIALHHTTKNKRKIAIYLDTNMKKVKVPQNRIGGKLYFGDIVKNEPNVPRIVNDLNPFRGCIRSLKINNSPQGIINNKNTLHHNIGQCFPNIEKGSYFRGDSFAIYNNFFRLSNFLEISFSFRTSEQNGIFLSISNIDNSPALSIELQNGAVVMSVDMGNGMVTNVTNKLTKYTICNNKWHHVRATFSTELTVNVDGVSQSWVLSDIGLLEQIEAPLYIGGLPDSAPGGTLKIRENFKGCINNLSIGNKIIDWIEMEELNNVSLNSCPVIL